MLTKKQLKLIREIIISNENNPDFEYDDCIGIRINKMLTVYPYNRDMIYYFIGDFLSFEYTGTICGYNQISAYNCDCPSEELDIDNDTPLYRLYEEIEDITLEIINNRYKNDTKIIK